MEISNNGNVVVIDDNIEEALPLIEALAKKSVPSIYYDGKLKNLPPIPIQGTRIIFLDMEFTSNMGEQNISSNLLAILSKIIDNNNGPYILILWSKRSNIYLNDFKEKLFSFDVIPNPIKILDMDKIEYFTTVTTSVNSFTDEICSTLADDNINLSPDTVTRLKAQIQNSDYPLVHYELKDDGIEKIEKRLYEELNKMNIFNILLLWENEIKKSSVNTINQFSGIEPIDENWSKNMKSLFSKIAIANAGKDNITGNADIIKSSFCTFINILFDNINLSLASNECLGEYIKDNGDENIEVLMEKDDELSNSKYLLMEDDKKIHYIIKKISANDEDEERVIMECRKCKYPFEVESGSEDQKIAIEILNKYVDYISKINSKILLCSCNNVLKQPGNVYSIKTEKSEKELLLKNCFKGDAPIDLILDKVRYVELEISPECDFAQNKWILNRTLPGIIVSAEYFKLIKDAEYIYTTPVLFMDNIGVCKLVFDFRFFSAHEINYLNDKELLLRFSGPLLTQIKNTLGFHVIRSGITYL